MNDKQRTGFTDGDLQSIRPIPEEALQQNNVPLIACQKWLADASMQMTVDYARMENGQVPILQDPARIGVQADGTTLTWQPAANSEAEEKTIKDT